jgi:hypothetical protein
MPASAGMTRKSCPAACSGVRSAKPKSGSCSTPRRLCWCGRKTAESSPTAAARRATVAYCGPTFEFARSTAISASFFDLGDHLFQLASAVPRIDTLIVDECPNDIQRIKPKPEVSDFDVFIRTQVPKERPKALLRFMVIIIV